MENRFILIVAAISALYYGVHTLRILPFSFRLIGALRQGRLVWPGPPTRDPDSRMQMSRQMLGGPVEHLFSAYFKYALGVIAAFVVSVMIALNYFFFWSVANPGQEWFAFGLPTLAAIVGGRLYLNRTRFNLRRIQLMLTSQQPRDPMVIKQFTDNKYGFRITAPDWWAISVGLLNNIANWVARRRVTIVCACEMSAQIWVSVTRRLLPTDDEEIKAVATRSAGASKVIQSGLVQVGELVGYQVTYETRDTQQCCVVFGNDTWLFSVHFKTPHFNVRTPTGTVFLDFMACVGTFQLVT